MRNKKLVLSFVLVVFALASFAQVPLWSAVDPASAKTYLDAKKDLLPANLKLIRLNTTQATQLQRQAIANAAGARSSDASSLFTLPLPDGSSLSTIIVDAPILSPELQALYPGIKTYQLIAPASGNMVARITISSMGISGIIFTAHGTAYINPLGPGYPDVHAVYYVKDLTAPAGAACGVKENLANLRQQDVQAGDGKKRTFRIAVAATGEYTAWAGSQANALTYITTTMNDIAAIYERDNTISFTLVSNNTIIYPTASTDPYATVSFPTGATLTSNQTALTSNIGTANFDLGIVFNDGWDGGLASVGVVCSNSQKGQAAAGLTFGTGANPANGPQGPFFDATAAHEIGHLFSATHTFAANNGSCSGNTTAATAYEPGGGSTLMAYAGACTGNSYQNHSDLYFHAGSIAQIQSYVTGGSASCSTPVVTSNHQPVVTVPASTYTIPISTPFTLTSAGTDADGNTLYYTWEQMDAGLVTSTAPLTTATSGPNFRSYPPALSNARTFPPIADLVAGNATPFEVLPSVARTMNFRVTARDEAPGNGATGEANVAVTTNATAGPFTVTSQSTATAWTANGTNTATITWNVANTTAAPVSCSTVDILFSIDGGYTYPYTLLANTPNDGTQTIVIPSLQTAVGRIKVQSHGNIFFNINTADIAITSSCTAEGTVFSPGSNVTAPSGSSSLHLTLNPVFGSVVTPSGTLTSTDSVSTLPVLDSVSHKAQVFDNEYIYDSYTFEVNVAGNYTLKVTGPFPEIMNLYLPVFEAGTPANNFITSNALYGDVSGSITISSTITVALVPGRFYTLTIGSFSNTQPTLPASYAVSVTAAPSGGNLYSGPVNPGGSFSYTYVIVDNSTGLIKAIDPGSDLSSSSTYPSGAYSVYGLSYASAAALSGYVGGPFSTLSNDLLYNPTGICGNLSKNLLVANVTASLPVQLLPLTATKKSGTVLLQWSTASEQNSNYFEVQRSADGAVFGTVLGTVNSAGNSSIKIDYQFTDAAPLPGINYYRVKQVDLDGKATYTNIAIVSFNAATPGMVLFPNPATALINIQYYSANTSAVKWNIVDGKGVTVSEGDWTLQAGLNLRQMNIGGLAAGTYLLRTVSNNQVMVSKFVKQ